MSLRFYDSLKYFLWFCSMISCEPYTFLWWKRFSTPGRKRRAGPTRRRARGRTVLPNRVAQRHDKKPNRLLQWTTTKMGRRSRITTATRRWWCRTRSKRDGCRIGWVGQGHQSLRAPGTVLSTKCLGKPGFIFLFWKHMVMCLMCLWCVLCVLWMLCALCVSKKTL